MNNPTPMPQDPSQGTDNSIMVNMDSLGDSAKSLKVGDEISMKVMAIQGDMIQLAPDMDSEPDADDTDPKTMPLDKLEASLPTADRE